MVWGHAGYREILPSSARNTRSINRSPPCDLGRPKKPARPTPAIYASIVDRRPILELRLNALATPARVADASKMMAEALECGFPNEAGNMSLVVENRDMRVHLSAFDANAVVAATALADFIANPTTEIRADDVGGMADAIEDYCRNAIEFEPTFWRPHKNRPFRVVNGEFLKHLRVVREDRAFDLVHDFESQIVHGTTTIISPVLRVGRLSESSRLRCRVRWASKAYEIEVASEVFSAFCEAAKHGRLMRISLIVAWKRGQQGELQFSRSGTRAIGIVDFKRDGLVNQELGWIQQPLMTNEEAVYLRKMLEIGRGDDE